jgi:predicted nucleic acid-binding protein
MKLDSKTAAAFKCPRYDELPSLSLYMDQVVFVIEEGFGIFADEPERVITSTMINNYVKQKLIEAPVKKKYNRSHIAVLIIVSMLKRVLSISEVAALVADTCRDTPLPEFYNLFCERFERLLKDAFAENGAPVIYSRDCLDSALAALIGKLMVQKFLSLKEEEK